MALLQASVALFAVVAVAAAAVGGVARWLSHRLGIVDLPGGRKTHKEPIAYLGGLAIAGALLLGLALLGRACPGEFLAQPRLATGIALGIVLIFAAGLWDDVRGMRPMVKLLCQCAVGALLWWAGARIERVSTGFGQSVALMGEGGLAQTLPSLLLTVGWFVTLMNSINLVDGLDGLAGGVSMICALSLAAVAFVVGTGDVMTLGLGLPVIAAGACLGFLFHNWHPARLFLGDSGSLGLGFILATSSLLASTKAPALMTLLVPLVALGLPIFETCFSFLRRIAKGQSPFRADRRHLHHRLLDLGLSPRRVVLFFLYATAFLGINSVLLARLPSVLLLANVAFLGVGLMLLIETLSYLEKNRK